MFILFKITRFKRKKFSGRTPRPPPLPYNCNITKTLNNAKTINSNMFWRVKNSGKGSYLWKDIALKAVTVAKLDFDHTYAEYTLKRPPSSFAFCLSNFSRRLDPLWRKFLDPRLISFNPTLHISPPSSVGSVLCLKSKGRWFEPRVNHYFSSNNVRLLTQVFTGEDPQSE